MKLNYICTFLVILGLSACKLIGTSNDLSQSNSNENTRSITPKDSKDGKWLVTMSVGGPSIKRKDALMLRDWATTLFTNTQGGLYNHAIDINDKHDGDDLPTYDQFNALFDKLSKNIKEYKSKNSQQKTMVIFTLTAHGIIGDDKQYQFRLLDKWIDGKHILESIARLNADETIIILQSCHSGALIEDSESIAEGLSLEAKEFFVKNDKHIAIVTPVTRHLVSPIRSWENVLSFSSMSEMADNQIEGKKDDVITYNEWRNLVKQQSCLHRDFSPIFKKNGVEKVLNKSGIDPQFIEYKIPSNLPIFLTNNGKKMWSENKLQLPQITEQQPYWYAETLKICQNETTDVENFYKADLDEKMNLLKTLSEPHRVARLLANLKKIFGDDRKRFIEPTIQIAKNAEIPFSTRIVAIELLSLYGQEAGIFEELVELYKKEDGMLKWVSFNGISGLNNPKAIDLFRQILDHDQNLELRQVAASGLLGLNSEESYQILKPFLNDKDPYIRSRVIIAGGKVLDRQLLPVCRNLLLNDRNIEIRLAALESLKEFGEKDDIKTYLLAISKETDSKVLGELLQLIYRAPIDTDLSLLLTRNSEEVLPPEITEASIVIFTQFKELRAKDIVLKALNHPSWKIREIALMYLSDVIKKDCEKYIANLLENDVKLSVRIQAVKSLAEIGSQESKNMLLRATTQNSEERVRLAAAEVLTDF